MNFEKGLGEVLIKNGGNKSKNLLELLKNNENNFNFKNFQIPKFIVYNPGDDIESLMLDLGNFNGLLAIRSDSDFEDSEDNSGAGVFETKLNIKNNIGEIKKAIDEIQKDAIAKVGEEISLVIQEMVSPEISGTVFGIDSRNENKNSYTINYVSGLGTGVVDGNKKNHIRIINKNFSLDNKDDLFLNIIKGVKEVEKIFGNDLLDIEFAYKNGQLYILQVRPLTALDSKNNFQQDKFITKVFSILEKNTLKKDCILGDMIDINPAELLKNSKSYLLNTLFAEIFPKGPLLEARKNLGYSVAEKQMYEIIFNKFYIKLEENLITFLPNNLDKEEKEIFIGYYKNLLKQNPNLQDKLDTIEYPNNIEIVEKILKNSKIENNKKQNIIQKFEQFFDNLENKFNDLEKNYFSKQQEILQNIFQVGSGRLEDIDINNLNKYSINELLEKVKEITYYFTMYARGAFYYRNQTQEQNLKYYNYFKYSNLLAGSDKKFQIPNGFDILDNILLDFSNLKKQDINLENYRPLKKEIFELSRENLKFLFMLVLNKIGEKIINQTKKLGIQKKDLYNLSLEEILKNLDNFEKLGFLSEKRETRAKKFENIGLPQVIGNGNIPGNFELLTSGTFIGKGKIFGEGIYINDVKKLYNMDLNKLKGKILLLDSATPEIDGVLSQILDNVYCIVTKYGGPGAHITLRIREENKKRLKAGKKEIGLVVGVGDLFENLKNNSNIILDFNKEKIG